MRTSLPRKTRGFLQNATTFAEHLGSEPTCSANVHMEWQALRRQNQLVTICPMRPNPGSSQRAWPGVKEDSLMNQQGASLLLR
jgi:hypothetical protein